MSNEVFFGTEEVIVSKTDLKGRITYVNDIFTKIAGYTEHELLSNPHSMIRHNKMPRCVFQLMWEYISAGDEIFAYVVNKCKNNDYYWVFAHVTPTFNKEGKVVAYHSNRRTPCPDVIQTAIEPLYEELLKIEESTANRKQGQSDAYDYLINKLNSLGVTYDEFVFSLNPNHMQKAS